jgi:hypothetical protein
MFKKNILFIYKIFASVEYSLFTNQVSDSDIDVSDSKNEYRITSQNPQQLKEEKASATENEQKTSAKTQNDVKDNMEDVEMGNVSESAFINNIRTTFTSSDPVREQVYNETTVKDDLISKLLKKETFWQFFVRNHGRKLIEGFIFLALVFLIYVFISGETFKFFYLGLMFLATSFLCILLLYRYEWKNFPPFSYF